MMESLFMAGINGQKSDYKGIPDSGIIESSYLINLLIIELMEFLSEYGLFLLKALTIIAIPLLALAIGTMLIRVKSHHENHLEVKPLNQKYKQMEMTLNSTILPKKAFKTELKSFKKQFKADSKKEISDKKRVYLINFKGDVRASAVESLREEITAILIVARPEDEVIVKIESGGGIVHNYGLAASQLQRIRSRGIPLTVSVDQIAASGGYMMACVANKIIAAPFAILGSIGVIGQLPNFSRLLKNHDIDYEIHTAGEYKRTLTMFGENSDKAREKFQAEIQETHQLFKDFIKKHREMLDLEKVATGEHWYGIQALELKLADELTTSDDYLREASLNSDLFEVTWQRKKSPIEKLFSKSIAALSRSQEEKALTHPGERTYF